MSIEKKEAYKEVLQKLPSMRERIYTACASSLYGLSKEEICQATGIKGTTVTGRLDELRLEGRIYVVEFTDRTHYVAANPENMHLYSKLYLIKKMEQHIKRGKKLFPNVLDEVWDMFNREVSKQSQSAMG